MKIDAWEFPLLHKFEPFGEIFIKKEVKLHPHIATKQFRDK